jgi:L-2,4-diaminobutyrate decarboxylase
MLEKLYDAESFRQTGHALIEMLARNLEDNLNRNHEKVIDFIDPEENKRDWSDWDNSDPMALFQKIIGNSIRLQHPRYMGHQVCFPAPLAVLAGFQGLMLNSGGAIYEMSMAASTLEKVVIDRLKPFFGLFDGDGFITSGGTIANLTALIAARNIKAPGDVWQSGQSENYAFMVSEEAHYCIERAVKIMGWGENGIIRIPVDDSYKMRHDMLDVYLKKAKDEGLRVLGVVGSAPTTSTGIHDDLKEIGLFCKKHDLWFHVDAAHGGPAVFTEKYKHLMRGCELADSIVVDAHKMMMVPSLTTLLFFARPDYSYKTFQQKAQYLWSGIEKEWYNYGKRTLECTKIMLSTRVYALMQTYGVEAFAENVHRCYDSAAFLAEEIKKRPELELATYPESNIVCFRVVTGDPEHYNALNKNIRQKMLESGHFYIVQTLLKGNVFLRVSIMNPFTTEYDLKEMLDEVLGKLG